MKLPAEYRGFKIASSTATAVGYTLPNSRVLSAQLGIGTHRQWKGVTATDGEGYERNFDSWKQAKAYIDNYCD